MIFANIMGQIMECGFDLNDFDINFIIKSIFTFIKYEIEPNIAYDLSFNFKFDSGKDYYYPGWDIRFDSIDDLSLLSSRYYERLISRYESNCFNRELKYVQVWLKLL